MKPSVPVAIDDKPCPLYTASYMLLDAAPDKLYKLERAIHAYMQRKVDLRGGAILAGVSYNHFMQEVQARNIVILEDDSFLESLALLAETFGQPALQDTVCHVLAHQTPNTGHLTGAEVRYASGQIAD